MCFIIRGLYGVAGQGYGMRDKGFVWSGWTRVWGEG